MVPIRNNVRSFDFSIELPSICGQFQVAEKYQYPSWSNSVVCCTATYMSYLRSLYLYPTTFLLVKWNLYFCVMQYLPSECVDWYAMRWLQADTHNTFSTTNLCCLLGTNRFVGLSSTPHGRSLTCFSSSIHVIIQSGIMYAQEGPIIFGPSLFCNDRIVFIKATFILLYDGLATSKRLKVDDKRVWLGVHFEFAKLRVLLFFCHFHYCSWVR